MPTYGFKIACSRLWPVASVLKETKAADVKKLKGKRYYQSRYQHNTFVIPFHKVPMVVHNYRKTACESALIHNLKYICLPSIQTELIQFHRTCIITHDLYILNGCILNGCNVHHIRSYQHLY